MPTPRGDLPATKAILGLFVAEPSTAKNVKARLRREHPKAAWSRSIVNTTVRALVEQDLIVLVHKGRKPDMHFYEATDKGITEFRRWLAEEARAPVPLRDAFIVWMDHSTEDELPELLTVAREQEETALGELDKAQERMNVERERGRLGPADGSDWNGRMRYAVLSRRVKLCNAQAELAKDFRLNLMQGYHMHRQMPEDDDG
jgi:DNA-binding PadR family transcriptional regulator